MIPRAFRIRHFKSIHDTGTCTLSGDGITVLAGQNEAGKTAVLSALRDFDLEAGQAPLTPEFAPEGLETGSPVVAVEFEVDADAVARALADEDESVPVAVIDWLRAHPRFWMSRDLTTNQFGLPDDLAVLLPASLADAKAAVAVAAASGEPDAAEEAGPPMTPGKTPLMTAAFADRLRSQWPTFIFFDSFSGLLPREVAVDAVVAELARRGKGVPTTGDTQALQPVLDFLALADVDVAHVARLGADDKGLDNYLRRKSAAITGDFLTYWKQKAGGESTVSLRVQHRRDTAGTRKLAFYVSDEAGDQYPEQRSRGFLWFLSFYLRLAAAKRAGAGLRRLLLIDEPGSYLHARAQRDVLHLFEDRIAKDGDAVVYSTHSPYLIAADARLHRLRVIAKSADGGTRAYDRLTHPDLRGAGALDTLSPVITAIGLDIRDGLRLVGTENVLVEGISDRLYVAAWAARWRPAFSARFTIFPGTGGDTLTTLASLLTGWGLPFVTLLDADKKGRTVRQRLTRDLLVTADRIVHPGTGGPDTGATIEDTFERDDFQQLLTAVDPELRMKDGESPSATMKRLNVDKVLIARTFAAQGATLPLLPATETSATALLDAVVTAAGVRAAVAPDLTAMAVEALT